VASTGGRKGRVYRARGCIVIHVAAVAGMREYDLGVDFRDDLDQAAGDLRDMRGCFSVGNLEKANALLSDAGFR
jgi:hypothetical protein